MARAIAGAIAVERGLLQPLDLFAWPSLALTGRADSALLRLRDPSGSPLEAPPADDALAKPIVVLIEEPHVLAMPLRARTLVDFIVEPDPAGAAASQVTRRERL